MPFDTTAMLFLFALFAGSLAASLSAALLYFNGSITTPGVFKIFGRVRFLQHAYKVVKSGVLQGPLSSGTSYADDATVAWFCSADSGLQVLAWMLALTIQHVTQAWWSSPAQDNGIDSAKLNHSDSKYRRSTMMRRPLQRRGEV